MEKKDFIEQLKMLTSAEDILAVSKSINELRSQFDDFCIEQERISQIAILDTEEQGEIVEVLTDSLEELKSSFYDIYNSYKENRSLFTKELTIQQESNFRKKKSLISQFQELIEKEENIRVAVESYKAIHENWKSIGDVPRENRLDIQTEFSKLIESFFFNIKIYRELKDHDLKRNTQLKKELVGKIDHLLENKSLRLIESQIKLFQNEFDEIGPVNKDEWDTIKSAYWSSVKAVYHKINLFYEEKREFKKENLNLKLSLLEKLTLFISFVSSCDDAKKWENATNELLDIQAEWKRIGSAPKKENEELWSEFRAQCDLFFLAKKKYFDSTRLQYDAISKRKEELIVQLNSVKNSTDWKEAGDKIIRIQQDWKKLGSAGQRNEQKLWKEFRNGCDFFFNSKKVFFEAEDLLNESNLIAKNELITEIQNYVLGDDKSKVIDDLKLFTQRFNMIGKVPFKDKDAVYKLFKSVIDEHYKGIKLEGDEKERVFFEAHIQQLKANPNASKLFEKERRDLELMIAKIQQDVNQLDNNLGFVSRSKSGDAFRKQIEDKINAGKKRISEYKSKIKLLRTNE